MTDPLDLAPLTADALASDPRLAEELAAAELPLVLLPVRLETRYSPDAAGTMLLVRIYPDQVHVDAHDPRLSSAELAAGQEFWRAQWRTGDNGDRRQRGWKTLADRFGPGRAGWIARATTPTNPQARPGAEVPDGTDPSAQPTFADLQPTEQRSTPVARLLPSRWTATAYAQGAVIAVGTGRRITIDPAVGPDLAAPLVHDDDDEVAAVDAGMNWLVDFTAAEDLGMALRLPVSGPVDLLLVTGVRGADGEGRELAALLDAQRYSEGLGFLLPEVPTNNAEGGSSGWSSAAAGAWSAHPALPAVGTFGALAATAFGLAADSFAPLPAANTAEDALAAAMSTVVWPASWGYWLPQFAGLSLDGTGWAAEHARSYVRPAGPLPTLRLGRQPYGLLPVTSLGRFAGDEREDRLRRILVGLVDAAWRPALGQSPRVGRGDVAADLVDVLRLGGRSDRVHLRRAFGALFAQGAQLFLGRRLGEAGFWDIARDRALPVAAAAGLGLLAGALTVHELGRTPVTLPLVSATDDVGYLADLLAADPDELAAQAEAAPLSLLAAIVRHGLLREHAAAAARLLAPDAPDATDEEFYGFGEGATGWTARRDQALAGGGTVRERLASGTDPAAASLQAFRAAVDEIATADLPGLERHLLGTLDTAAFRLDAWVTSLAARRLAALREARPRGVVVGGYGWAEQLTPLAVAPVTELPDGEPGPLLAALDDPGYLHAPSLHQAQVAALLRNAHLANGGAADGPFAISLTSERVRLARWIFDGVRAGRTAGAVLGYLVERDLHDRRLDASIDNAREVCPLPGEEDLPVPARRLDGLRLHKLWADSEDHAIDHLVGNDQSDTTRNRARAVLRRLNVAVDAAADAIQAEQVHQFARGDLTRAVNSLADFDRGLVPPPSLDFVQTPRSGVGVTHRVGVLMDPDAPSAAGWGGPADSPRAASEPGLDAWLGRLLGAATGRSLTVRDAAAQETPAGNGTAVPLPDLQLPASDFVRIAGAGDQGLAELAARAALASTQDPLRPVLVVDPGLRDLLELGRSLAELLGPARPMDGTALQPPHADPLPGTDLDELAQRADAARAAVEEAAATLEEALSGAAPLDRLRAAVATTWPLAIGDAAIPVETTPEGWSAAAVRARSQLGARLAEADSIEAPAGDTGRQAQLLRTLRTLLGPGSVALPRFLPSTVAALVASRDDPGLGGDPLTAEVWLTRMERVREPLRQLAIALREAESLGGPAFTLRVAQVPHPSGAVWNALPAQNYVDGAASIVLTGAELIAAGKELSGLLIDEWGEVIPSASETTGVAFRYDPPDLMAPQAILLAVPPVIDEPWTVGTLNQVLIETLEQAHLRAVPPAALGAVRQYLPATVLAFNTDGDAVSTNPNALTPGLGG